MRTPTLEIEYRDLASELKVTAGGESSYEFSDRKAHHTDIGLFHERSIICNGVRINEIRTNFRTNCKIDVNDACLSDSLHLCLPISGSVGGVFEDAGISAVLRPKTHHYMFVKGDQYELSFDREVKLAHIEFGISYFNSLLCPSERWSAELKEKLLKQEVVYSGGSIACRSTNEVIHAILDCQLTGNLRKLFIEAKVIELLTLQLQHYRGINGTDTQVLKKSEQQLMHEVKSFLLTNFCDEHSLKSLALHFGINEFKLKKNFKLQFGQTIFDFIFDLKMDHAYRLLREGERLVNEVSREVGYKNPNHFATAFAKKFGVSPSKLKC
jgi:AraC family transcriptional regulator, transcriptional activator of the genes for pyochelin and ferripyochelin receptors